MAEQPELSAEKLAEIERRFDPETAFRKFGPRIALLVSAVLVAMSVYHFYAAGFALIRELLHRGIHLAFVLGLVFLLFAVRRGQILAMFPKPAADWRYPIPDVLALLAVAAALYLPLLPPQIIADRVGNPGPSDIFFGSCLLLLEASRRSIGPTTRYCHSLSDFCLFWALHARRVEARRR